MPWADWAGTAEPGGQFVPGAQQLELLRRLNQAGAPSSQLRERVLAASAPGRGQPDLELLGAATESRFGPRPVDPGTLPDRELLRVAASILAEDVVARGLPSPPRVGRPRPWRRPYRLLGDPELVVPALGRPRRPRPSPRRTPRRSTWSSPPTSAGCSPTCGPRAPSTPGSAAGGSGCDGWQRNRALPGPIDPLHLARTQTGRAAPRPDPRRPRPGRPADPCRRTPTSRASPGAGRGGARPGPPDRLGGGPPGAGRPAAGPHAPHVAALAGRGAGEPAGRAGRAPRLAARPRRHASPTVCAGLATLSTATLAALAPVRRPGVEAPAPRATLALAMQMMLCRAQRGGHDRGGEMTSRVLLHVGTPKTGTSYLQDVLFRNREVLKHAGILYPADRFDAHFLAALDLMQLPWGGLESEAHGAWDRMAAAGPGLARHRRSSATRSWPRPRAPRSRGRCRHWATPTPRCTWSCRCATWSARSLPSGRRTSSTAAASATATSSPRSRIRRGRARVATWFWGVQEIPDILNRWGADLPPERVHLVTVPAPGGPPDLLWERFCEAFGTRWPRPRPRGRADQPVPRRRRDRAAAPDQPQGERGGPAGALPAAGPRAARPPDPVAPDRLAAADPAPRRPPLGAGAGRRPGSTRSRSAATT